MGCVVADAVRVPKISENTALARRVRALVRASELAGKAAVLGEIAVVVAGSADRARIDGDLGGFVRISRDLERLLDRVAPDAPMGGATREGSSVQPGSDEPGGLELILGSGPEVRDAAV